VEEADRISDQIRRLEVQVPFERAKFTGSLPAPRGLSCHSASQAGTSAADTSAGPSSASCSTSPPYGHDQTCASSSNASAHRLSPRRPRAARACNPTTDPRRMSALRCRIEPY
jgi:hypothetical protein